MNPRPHTRQRARGLCASRKQTRKERQQIRAALGRQVSPTRGDQERHSPCSVVSLQLTPRAPVFLPHPAIRREMMDLTQGRDRVSVWGTRAFVFLGPEGPGIRARGPLEPLSVAHSPAPGGALTPGGLAECIPAGTPPQVCRPKGRGENPNTHQRVRRDIPHPNPDPGRAAPSRPPAEPGAGAGPGSGLGLLRPLPAPGGALRRLRGCRSCGALSELQLPQECTEPLSYLPPRASAPPGPGARARGRSVRKGRGGPVEGRSPRARALGGAYRRSRD